jgi:hypothetical protein
MGINFGDARSFKMAVVADYFVNPQNYKKLPQSHLVYDQLRDSGYGIIKMPHPSMVGKGLEGWVVSTVDQIQEYSNRGFRVLVLGADGIPGQGIWMINLRKEVKKRGLSFPKSIVLKKRDLQSLDAIKMFLE